MKQILYTLCAAALLAGCQKENHPAMEPHEPQELRFRTFIEEGGEVRPVEGPASRSLVGDLKNGYRLSAHLTTANYPTTTGLQPLMSNVQMNRDGSYKNLTEPKYFWAEGNANYRHTFVAYSENPDNTESGKGVQTATLKLENGVYKVDYFASAGPALQLDFLYAENMRNLQPTGPAPTVDLVFKHRLARVMFTLMGTGGIELNNCKAQIKYAGTTKPVSSRATLTLSDNGGVDFIGYTFAANTHDLGTEFTLPATAISPETAVEVGDMILIPQKLVDGWIEVALTYTPEGSATPQTLKMDMTAVDLTAAGKQCNVVLRVDVERSVLAVEGITLTPWSSKTGSIDATGSLPNPPTPDKVIELNGLKWARGNLVAKDEFSCEVGDKADHGLYFKYGSLVGYKGGANGDGRGMTSTSVGNDLVPYTIPISYSVAAPVWSSARYHKQTPAEPYPALDNPTTAVGDPCRFYLGDPWRLPTRNDYNSLKYGSFFGSSPKGVWAGKDPGGGIFAGYNDTNAIYFTAAGMRNNNTGVAYNVDATGAYLGSSYYTPTQSSTTHAPGIEFYSGTVIPDSYWYVPRGYPVRCVSPID